MKKVLTKILILLTAIFFVIYFYVQIRTIFDSAITTQPAELATVEIKIDAECYILRDEIVIESDTAGVYNYLIKEGDKLAKKQEIAHVYSSESDLDIHNKVNEINKQIQVLENSSIENNYLKTNISKLDSEINSFVTILHTATSEGDFSLAVQNKYDFLTLLNKRNLVVRSESGYDSLIEDLNEEKDRLTAELSDPVDTVRAPASGLFYSFVDGYEEIFNFEALESLTVDSFYEMIASSPETQKGIVGKIITDFKWYTLCIVNRDEAVFYNSGNYYDIVYPYTSSVSIKSLLSAKITQADRDEVILVFATEQIPDDFNFSRHQKAQIIRSEYSGLKVSKDALRIVDGYEGIYVLSGNVVKFRRCQKICEADGYYVIDIEDPLEGEKIKYGYIQMYDSVITSGKNLYDGRLIG